MATVSENRPAPTMILRSPASATTTPAIAPTRASFLLLPHTSDVPASRAALSAFLATHNSASSRATVPTGSINDGKPRQRGSSRCGVRRVSVAVGTTPCCVTLGHPGEARSRCRGSASDNQLVRAETPISSCQGDSGQHLVAYPTVRRRLAQVKRSRLKMGN